MNNESQNTEYKLTWRDEYLKWVCGFANAQGGTIYIGIDDKGDAFESYGLKTPQFEFTCGGLNTIIYRNEKFAEEQDALLNVTVNDDDDSKDNETAQRTTQRIAQRNAQRTAQRILEAIGRNPQATVANLSAELGISERTTKTHIAHLKQDGLIERINGKTYGYWKIIEQ